MIKDRSFYKTIVRLSLPTAFQALMSILVVMADNMMVAHLSDGGNALAAASQANSITNFFNAAIRGLASGAVVLIAQYWGKQDKDRIREICSVVFKICIAFTLLIILVIVLFPGKVLPLVISAKETVIIDLAQQYLVIVCFSYLPFAVSTALIGMLKGVEIVKITLYTTIVSLVSNILLNYILMFGKLGLPAMGIRGAAYATVMARCIEAYLVWLYFFKIQRTLSMKPHHLLRSKKWAWQDFFRYGAPVGLTDAQWALVGMLKMVIIGQMGKQMINAVAVSDMMMNLGTIFTGALAGGASVVVGKAVGRKEYPLVRQYSTTIQLMFLGIGLVMSFLTFITRNPFISLYNLEPGTAKLASVMIALGAITLIGTTYHASCFIGINRGAGDNRFVMLVDMICGWLIVLPAAAISAFVLHLPMEWIYFSTRIDQCFKWIIAFLRLRGDRWIHNVTRQ